MKIAEKFMSPICRPAVWRTTHYLNIPISGLHFKRREVWKSKSLAKVLRVRRGSKPSALDWRVELQGFDEMKPSVVDSERMSGSTK